MRSITGSHAQAGKQKTVEHHVLHVHLVEREPPKVKSSAPQGSGQGASAVTQKPELPVCRALLCHAFFTVAHASSSARAAAARRLWLKDSVGDAQLRALDPVRHEQRGDDKRVHGLGNRPNDMPG